MLTSMSVGAPSDVTGFQSVEGYVIPPEESLNGTTRYGYLLARINTHCFCYCRNNNQAVLL